MIEVMVAMLVLAIGLLGLAGITVVVLRSNSLSQQISQATALASSLLENLRAQPDLVACTSVISAPSSSCKQLTESGISNRDAAFWPASQFAPAGNACVVSNVLSQGSAGTFDVVSSDGAPWASSGLVAADTVCSASILSNLPRNTFVRYYQVSAIGTSELRLVSVVLFQDKFGKWRAVALDTRRAQ